MNIACKLSRQLVTLIVALTATFGLHAQESTDELSPELVKLLSSLDYKQGEITLKGGFAKINVPKGFSYLDSEDAVTVLVDLWGNPPSNDKPLGLLIPEGMSPLDMSTWVVTIDYSKDGYVKDNDAASIDYNDLLKDMKKGTREANKTRKEYGYPTVELLGWAEQPHYDAASHKLYWAKKLQFEGDETPTLNYDIRILGRKGVLVLSAIAGVDQLDEINKNAPNILGMIDFTDGNRYADYNPSTDKVAEYGIAALVAGGIAAKTGVFKGLLVALLAAKKFIIVGLIAVAAFVTKILGGKANV